MKPRLLLNGVLSFWQKQRKYYTLQHNRRGIVLEQHAEKDFVNLVCMGAGDRGIWTNQKAVLSRGCAFLQ